MDFPSNQVILYKHQLDLGPHMQTVYDNLVNADITGQLVKSQILTDKLEEYLNQYFSGAWRLLRRVEEFHHHPGASPYKIAYYVLQFDTDTDAETVESRLKKDGYKTPVQKNLTGKMRLIPPKQAAQLIIGGKTIRRTGGNNP